MADIFDFYVHDNRKITYQIAEPIMREDNGVTDFVFHIPKSINGLDMSDWAWWFVFVNAKNEKYSILLTLVDEPDRPLEYNAATYTVDYAMSIKAGSVHFALEAINTGTGGVIDNEWHTLTYETKVKETLQGNQVEYAETESDIISALLIEVRNKVNQLVGGATPTPVSAVSQMTDTSKVYLLTSDGEWYYYNGSAWVSGGLYGAGVVDSVPTHGSTNAVQSGGVYSALADINSDVADLDLRVEELEQGGSGGLSMTAVNLLNTILTEAVYGSDQTANITLLYKELSNVPPVSISAVLDGTALAGQSYSELSFIVTATFDDDSTQVVDNYTIVTTGTVTAGSNTVTIRYRGITTTCTFTAEQVVTYSITYNLTDVTSSNNTTVVRENTRYATEISTDSDHYISSFTVTMGGVDVTATVRNGNNIVIDAVTGNVVITVVANAYVYLDPLIVKRPFTNEGDSTTYLYTDEYVTKASPETINYAHVGKVTEYPAKYDCTLNWTITNTSESTVSFREGAISNLGFGLIKDTDEYINNNAIAYWQKIDNTSHGLEPGESISGTYQMKAGWQLILTTVVANTNALTERIRGDYVAEDFSDYNIEYSIAQTELTPKEPYKARTYYSDDGTTEIRTQTGNFYQYASGAGVFEYDAVTRMSPVNIGNANNINAVYTGYVDTLSDSDVYYAQQMCKNVRNSNLWKHVTLKAVNSGMYWIFSTNLFNRASNYTMEIKAKEVSA